MKDIQYCKKLANTQEGECLDTIYRGIKHKYTWKCRLDHVFEMRADDVKEGHWCKRCARNRRTLMESYKIFELCKKHASYKEGKLLSAVYINNRTLMLWQCKFGHTWKTCWNNIQNGHWCHECSNSIKKNENPQFPLMPHPNKNDEDHCKKYLRLCKQIAKEKDGECLSNQYVNSQTKIYLKCKNNHHWFAKPNNLWRGQWCRVCSKNGKSKPEEEIFEFVKNIKPDSQSRVKRLLKNSNLEIDVWIPGLKIAIEFDGPTHDLNHRLYKAYNKNNKRTQADRDLEKSTQCYESGIKLLRISYKDWDNDKDSVLNKIKEFLLLK